MNSNSTTDRKMRCASLSEELRADFNIDNLSAIDVFALAKTIPKLSILLFPLGESISGLCVKQPDYSLIAVNSGQTYGRQRFTLSHELFHLYFDNQAGTIICPSNALKASNVERDADSFASFFLMPRLALKRELRNRDISPTRPLDDELLRSIIELEQKYGMSRSALLVRLEDEQAISREQKEWLSHDVKKNAFRLGFSAALYNRSQGESVKQTSGYYVDLIGELLANGAISRGKAREYLSGGFRNDIHVIELEGDDVLD